MDRFFGRHAKKIDAKGRVSVPAPFRAIVAREAADGLYAFSSLWLDCVDAGGAGLMKAVDDALGGLSPLSPEYDEMAVTIAASGEQLALDPEGRFLVPEWMREKAGIDDEVLFVGALTKFMIWSPQRYAAYEEAARFAAVSRLRGAAKAARGGLS